MKKIIRLFATVLVTGFAGLQAQAITVEIPVPEVSKSGSSRNLPKLQILVGIEGSSCEAYILKVMPAAPKVVDEFNVGFATNSKPCDQPQVTHPILKAQIGPFVAGTSSLKFNFVDPNVESIKFVWK